MKSAVLSSAIKLCTSWGGVVLRSCFGCAETSSRQSDAELVACFRVLEEPEADWMEKPCVDFTFNTTAFITALREEGVFYCEDIPDVLLWDWQFNSEKIPPDTAQNASVKLGVNCFASARTERKRKLANIGERTVSEQMQTGAGATFGVARRHRHAVSAAEIAAYIAKNNTEAKILLTDLRRVRSRVVEMGNVLRGIQTV
eukprot:3940620-Rhodomonas_salina.1